VYWGIIAGLFGFAVVYAFTTIHLVFPDSMYYYGRALYYAGYSQTEAHQLVQAFAERQGWGSPDADMLFNWTLVAPRVVYPALSAPFVYLWGYEGLLVVPFVATTLIYFATAWVLRVRYGMLVGLATMLVVLQCQHWIWQQLGPLCEVLTAFWLALTLGAVWCYRRFRPSRGAWLWLVAAGVCTVLLAFTRQAMLIPAGAFFMVWVGEWIRTKRVRNSWLAASSVVVGVSAACQLYQMVRYPFDQTSQMQRMTGTAGVKDAIWAMPGQLYRVLKSDFELFWKADQSMLVCIALVLVGLVVCWRQVESHLAFGALAGGMIYQATNGSLSTSLRYCQPGLVTYLLVIAALLAWLANKRDRRRSPVSQNQLGAAKV
jgi:hypothetical protein